MGYWENTTEDPIEGIDARGLSKKIDLADWIMTFHDIYEALRPVARPGAGIPGLARQGLRKSKS